MTLEGGDEGVQFQIKGKKLEMRIALNPDQPWRLMMNKRPGLYIEHLGLHAKQHYFWLDLRAWVVFHPPTKAPIQDVRVWCQKLFVPGGQFESNRRQH